MHRVALVTSSFAPHVGGVETHVARVAEELVRSGHHVEVWAVDQGARTDDVRPQEFMVRYLPTPLPALNPRSLVRFAARFPSAIGAWRQAHREFAPTVLHVHCFGPNGIYGTHLSRRSGVPLVITSHGETRADDHNAFDESWLLRWGLRSAIERAGAVTAPSEFVLADLTERFGLTGGTVVPNGVDALPRDRPADAPSGRYILGVGRLGRNKGFDLLVKAFADTRALDDARLTIIGDGPERESLQILARSIGVGGRVEFLGRLAPEAVAVAMQSAIAVVVPSRIEAFGIVALEAWRSGAALIMTNRGGGPEFIRDGEDALLVDPTRTPELVRAIERVTCDPALRQRLVAAGRRRWAEFTWERVATGYEQLYDEVAAASRPARGGASV